MDVEIEICNISLPQLAFHLLSLSDQGGGCILFLQNGIQRWTFEANQLLLLALLSTNVIGRWTTITSEHRGVLIVFQIVSDE